MMIRRTFLKLGIFSTIFGMTTVLAMTPVPSNKLCRYGRVKYVPVGGEFTIGNGKWRYRKVANGYYTKNAYMYMDTVLLGDADVIRLNDGLKSWMGPLVEID